MAKTSRMKRSKNTIGPDWERRERYPAIAEACAKFLTGTGFQEIASHLNAAFGTTYTRQNSYEIIQFAARNHWLTFTPPPEKGLAAQARERYALLEDVRVSATSNVADIARCASEMAWEILVKKQPRVFGTRSIAYGNGRTVRRVAEHMANRLIQPIPGLSGKLRFQAVSAGVDSSAVGSDASAFLTCFTDDRLRHVEKEFDVLHAPSIVPPAQHDELIRDIPAIANSRDRLGDLDLLVTAASSWHDPHCTLRNQLAKDYPNTETPYRRALSETFRALETAGVEGEMLFLPFGKTGPIDQSQNRLRAFSLLEFNDLSRLIGTRADGTKVLLVIGPCLTDGCSRAPLLQLLMDLNRRHRWFTHLVVDSATIREVLGAGA